MEKTITENYWNDDVSMDILNKLTLREIAYSLRHKTNRFYNAHALKGIFDTEQNRIVWRKMTTTSNQVDSLLREEI